MRRDDRPDTATRIGCELYVPVGDVAGAWKGDKVCNIAQTPNR